MHQKSTEKAPTRIDATLHQLLFKQKNLSLPSVDVDLLMLSVDC